MVSIGYPQEILEFEYDPTFAVRFVQNNIFLNLVDIFRLTRRVRKLR